MLGFRTVARFAERCHNLDRGLGLPPRAEPSNSRAVFMKLGLGKGIPETVLDISEWIDPKGEGQPSGLTQIGLGRIDTIVKKSRNLRKGCWVGYRNQA